MEGHTRDLVKEYPEKNKTARGQARDEALSLVPN